MKSFASVLVGAIWAASVSYLPYQAGKLEGWNKGYDEGRKVGRIEMAFEAVKILHGGVKKDDSNSEEES